MLGAVAGASLVQNSKACKSAIIWQIMAHAIRDVSHQLQWRNTASKSKSEKCVIWNKYWGSNTYQGPYMTQDFCVGLLLEQLSELLQTTWKAVWGLNWWWWLREWLWWERQTNKKTQSLNKQSVDKKKWKHSNNVCLWTSVFVFARQVAINIWKSM